jgi:LPXTG-motif cell wall-anchored protein
MDTQLVLIGVMVVLAVLYVLRRRRRIAREG